VADKVSHLLESNERLLDPLVGVYGYKDDWNASRGDNRKQWNNDNNTSNKNAGGDSALRKNNRNVGWKAGSTRPMPGGRGGGGAGRGGRGGGAGRGNGGASNNGPKAAWGGRGVGNTASASSTAAAAAVNGSSNSASGAKAGGGAIGGATPPPKRWATA